MAPVARAPAVDARPGRVRRPRDRIRDGVRAVAAVVGTAAGAAVAAASAASRAMPPHDARTTQATWSRGPASWPAVARSSMAQLVRALRAAPHVVPIDMSAVERIDFVCAGALLNAINRVESAAQGGADRRRVADHPRAAAAHRHLAAPLPEEAAVALAERRSCRAARSAKIAHGTLSRHHHPLGPPRRRRRARRRRPGHARQRRRQGDRAQGPPPLPRPACSRASRARPPTRSRCSSASRPSSRSTRAICARSAVELAKDWRSDRVLRRLEAMLAVADRTGVAGHHRHRRRARARARHRRDRLGRRLRAGRGARAAAASAACPPRTSSRQSLTIAGDLCIYTNQNHVDRDARCERSRLSVTSADYDVVRRRRRPAGPRARRGACARRALASRSPIARRSPAPRVRRSTTCDARVYAISPGSAAVPARARRVAAAAGGPHRRRSRRCASKAIAARAARLLRLRPRRARARVDRRGARAARGAAAAASAMPASTIVGAGAVRRACVRRRRRHARRCDDGRERSLRAARRRRRRRCARGCAQAAGIVAEPRAYGQTGVVANFACERAHRGVARQWFRADGGVLAWLPLPGRAHLDRVVGARRAGGRAAGARRRRARRARRRRRRRTRSARSSRSRRRRRFPLSFLRLPTTVAHRLALVGDAAHGVHPLAGQGVNLGFGDAQALAAGRSPSAGRSHDPGAPLLLERYARRRVEPVLAMQAVTDGLARLFGHAAAVAVGRCATPGWRPSIGCRSLKRVLAQPALR